MVVSDEQVADIERYLAGVYDGANCISVRSGIYLRHVKVSEGGAGPC